MELQEYLRVLRDYWRSTLAVLFLCVALSAGFTLLQAPTYTANSAVFLTVESGGTAGELSQGATYAERQVKSYVTVATTAVVLDPVIDELDLDLTPNQLAKKLTITSPTSTSVIKISAQDSSPQQAAALGNAVARSLQDAVQELSPPGPDGTRMVSATVIDQAVVPTTPSAPNPVTNIALGVLLGLLLGFGQALLRNILDTRIRTNDDVERVTDAPVLASIGRLDTTADRVENATGTQWANAEAYRRLRTNVGFVGLGGERRSSIVVTSSVAGEGKTQTVTNLARVLAQAGESVLLIDADLRRPQVASRMGLDSELGLSDVLSSRGTLEDLTIEVAPNLAVLTAGTVPPNPSELMGSQAMAQLLANAESKYDYVLFDSPPLLPVTDAVVLGAQTGGAIVVSRSGKVRRPQLEGAFGLMEAGGVTLLGVVLNDVSTGSGNGYGSYDGYYTSHVESTPASKEPGKRASRPAKSSVA